MVASTTPPSTEPLQRIAVACSGGRDSIALLHATARMAHELGGTEVVALHVHHGLSPQADAWLAHVQGLCTQWAAQGWPVSFQSRHVNLQPGPGDSVEALARQARYRALASMASEAGCAGVMLAHHRQDQAETFVLQALRGAGVAGLAAMPREAQREGITWLRPWLDQPRAVIEAYVAKHQLSWVDDDSNADERYARNRLRLGVWPALRASFEQAEASLAQAAAHQADVLACLQDWLVQRLPEVTAEQGAATVLQVEAWLAHAPGPQRELLRAWFRRASGVALPHSWVMRLQAECEPAASMRWPLRLQAQDRRELVGALTLHRGLLAWEPDGTATYQSGQGGAGLEIDRPEVVPLLITAPCCVPVPAWGGELLVSSCEAGGIPLALLAQCRLKPRLGSEQFQLAPGRPARSLKKQFQMLGVPAWARHGPLLWAGDQLVLVPGLGLDARVWAALGQPMVSVAWRPNEG
jgi:tRNA(Ile)-lysidine synthase